MRVERVGNGVRVCVDHATVAELRGQRLGALLVEELGADPVLVVAVLEALAEAAEELLAGDEEGSEPLFCIVFRPG